MVENSLVGKVTDLVVGVTMEMQRVWRKIMVGSIPWITMLRMVGNVILLM
jgi:hypothetical protein